MPEAPRTPAALRRALASALPAMLALSLAPSARAATGAAPTPPVLPTDPVLARLVEESLAARPELRQAEATVRAERERVPQAGALPDPVLSLGIQNDGFQEIQVGKMETSFYLVGLSQGIPWPGKRGLRSDVARLAADEAGAGLGRARLTTEADVRRTYTDLLSARDRLALLRELEALWQTSAGTARARYESGEGAQSDVLRAQLELNRLKQRRWALGAQEAAAVQTLNPVALAQAISTRYGVPAANITTTSYSELKAFVTGAPNAIPPRNPATRLRVSAASSVAAS